MFTSLNPLYLIIDKIDDYIEENNRNEYWTLLPIDASQDTLNKYEKLWNKIRNFIWSVKNNSNNYNEKYMKIKCYWDEDLRLKEILKLHSFNSC